MMNAAPVAGSAFTAGALTGGVVDEQDERLRITFIGDSNTEYGYYARWNAGFPASRSNATGLSAGEGTLTIYSDSTATWTAPGDTAGPVTDVGGGFIFLQSGSANKGMCFNITAAAVAAYGSPEGTPLPFTVEASSVIGRTDVCPCVWSQIYSGQKLVGMANLGMSGDTIEGVEMRVAQVGEVNSLGQTVPRRRGIYCITIGINNVTGSLTPEEITALCVKLTNIKNILRSRGDAVIFGNLAHGNPSAGELAEMQALNAHIATFTADPLVAVADIDAVCTGDTDKMNGVHYKAPGAAAAGMLVAAKILAFSGGTRGVSDFRRGGRSDNLVTNGALDGTAGVLTGMTGEAAVDSTYTKSGSGTCLASKQAVAGQHDWQVYTVTNASAGDTIEMVLPMTAVPGTTIYGQAYFDVTGAGIQHPDAIIEFNNASDTVQELIHACAADSPQGDIGPYSGILGVPRMSVPAWEDHSRMLVSIKLMAGNSVVKVRDIGAGVSNE